MTTQRSREIEPERPERKAAISEFLKHKIAYDIRIVLNLYRIWLVQIYSGICAGYLNAINRAYDPQKNQPVLRRA
jgi:hypothetical protein